MSFSVKGKELVVDVGIALLWAALIVLIVLFSAGQTKFIYIDF
ncbi:MAG: hypothetical protein PHO70_00365 [Candidatus Omnitrophica bacterium]|nr:hypothetical protein [Candidatus Omnitrophota bacterium]